MDRQSISNTVIVILLALLVYQLMNQDRQGGGQQMDEDKYGRGKEPASYENLSYINDRCEILQAEISSINAKVQNAMEKLSHLKADVHKGSHDISYLKRKCQREQQNMKILWNAMGRAQQTIAQIEQDITKNKAFYLNENKAQFNQLYEGLNRIKDDIIMLEMDLESRQSELEQMDRDFEDLEELNNFLTQATIGLRAALRKNRIDLEITTRNIHRSSTSERKARLGGSAATLLGTALVWFPPTTLLGAGLMGAGTLTGLGSVVGGWAHQKQLYTEGMEKVDADLRFQLENTLNRFKTFLEGKNIAELSEVVAAKVEEVQILYVEIANMAIMSDTRIDRKDKEAWLSFLGLGSSVASVSTLSAVGVRSTLLAGRALKLARAATIKDAIKTWNMARAAGNMYYVTKGAAIKNAVHGFNAARSASAKVANGLSSFGAYLGVASFLWDSYELIADNPTDLEQECQARADHLRRFEDYLASGSYGQRREGMHNQLE